MRSDNGGAGWVIDLSSAIRYDEARTVNLSQPGTDWSVDATLNATASTASFQFWYPTMPTDSRATFTCQR